MPWTSSWVLAKIFSGATFSWSDSSPRDPSWSGLSTPSHSAVPTLILVESPWSEFSDTEIQGSHQNCNLDPSNFVFYSSDNFALNLLSYFRFLHFSEVVFSVSSLWKLVLVESSRPWVLLRHAFLSEALKGILEKRFKFLRSITTLTFKSNMYYWFFPSLFSQLSLLFSSVLQYWQTKTQHFCSENFCLTPRLALFMIWHCASLQCLCTWTNCGKTLFFSGF